MVVWSAVSCLCSVHRKLIISIGVKFINAIKTISIQFYRLMVVQLEKREALAKEAKIMERKKAQKTSKRLRQAATMREKQSRNNRSSSSGEYSLLCFY